MSGSGTQDPTTRGHMAGHTTGRIDDTTLVLEAQRGNRAAFEELVRHYDQAVLRLALQILLIVTSLILTLLILLHKGRGGGLSDMFGGGMSSSMGSSGVAERNLNRFTIGISVIWATVIVLLNLLTRFFPDAS